MKTMLAAVTACLLLTACAASPSGGLAPSEPVRFTSKPPGALVTAADGGSCVTPCTLRFGIDAPAVFAASHDGYLSADGTIGVRIFRAGTALDAAGLASGDPVDALSSAFFIARGKGNNQTLESHSVHIILKPAAGN